MGISGKGKHCLILFGLIWALLATPVSASELPPFELDPILSLTGDCSTSTIDPVPDPSCPYPPPPGGPVGRFEGARAITIDRYGNEYVASFAQGDDAKGRVDIFDDEGKFITEAGIPNVQTMAVDSKGNLYVFENDGDVVRYEPSEYEPETASIEYAKPPVTVSTGSLMGSIAVDTSAAHLDQLLVVRPEGITRYESAEEGGGVIESFEPEGLGSWPEAIAIDSERRRIYVASCKDEIQECGVMVVEADAPHAILKDLDGSNTPAGEFASTTGLLSIAVDEQSGDFFVADYVAKMIYRFSEDYEYLSQLNFTELQGGVQIAVSNGKRSPVAEPCEYPTDLAPSPGDACNRHYLFVPVFKANGRAVAFHPAAQTAPVIEAVSTGPIGETEAELSAAIFPGGLETKYHFEITTEAAYDAEEFQGATILAGGMIQAESLTAKVSTFATGLTPGETYRFRVVAENDLGKADEDGQNEAVFSTYSDAPLMVGCPNQALRVGLSALLPDCRAYELVTPAETNGRPPKGVGFVGNIFTTQHSSPSGGAVSFKIPGGSVPGSSGVGGFEGDPYVATRGAAGWNSALAGPTGDETTVSIPAGISPDQGYMFWEAQREGSAVVNGERTEYIRYPDGHSELIGRGSLGVDPGVEGRLITENASHIVFETINIHPTVAIQLEPNAPPTGTEAVYDRTINPATGAEETHVVSLLPGDVTPEPGQHASYVGASKDGEGIAFEIDGTLYLRVGNETTHEVGENVEFAGISEGGKRIFYVQGGDLKAFDTAVLKVIDFSTTGNVVPVNVATGGTRAAFISPSVLGSANPLSDVAQPGEPNLYLSTEGEIEFVATVTDRDVEGEPIPFATVKHDGLGLWTKVGNQLAIDPSRLTPDGTVLLFQSRAEITGYEEGEFPQIYRYDSDNERLQCISCIPTGIPASGGASLESYTFDSFSSRPLGPNAFVPNLALDGNRVFFESTEALVSTDSDEVNDVYEWQEKGVGGCDRTGGCLYLISSGQSGRDNFLYAHSISGDDVFFTTGDVLTGWDTGGAVSIYDARVGGGFPEPAKDEDCIGEGCQPTPLSPSPPMTAPTTKPSGRLDSSTRRKSCPQGKRKVKKKGKVRCVKKRANHKAKKRAGASAGAGK